MNALIEVFRMTEISATVRANIIIQLGDIINFKYSANVTEALVYELVSILDSNNRILNDEHYITHHNRLSK